MKCIYIRFFLFLIVALLSYSNGLNAQQELSLDGEWQIIFDKANIGKTEQWTESSVFDDQDSIRSINVPSAWELIEQDYEGVAFYKKTFTVPQSWENKIIRLQFGAVNYLSEVWLNDEVVGFNEGGFTPFEFRVDEMIKPGEENVLTMRVMGPIMMTDQEIDGYGKLETAQWRGGITGGIYQSVNLVATGNVYVEDVFIQPNIHDNTATLHVTLDQTAIKKADLQIQIDISESIKNKRTVVSQVEKWNVSPGINQSEWKLTIPNTKYWSTNDPNLYTASIKIMHEGNLLDEWSSRFGMRELTIKDKDFYFNGEKIYIKAAFFEAIYPNGITYPDSEDMARKEIRLAKEAGFNTIRPWRKPATPMWLDLADEMGVMVVGSPALECMTLPLSTAYLPKRVEHEVRNTVLRDRNHACIVQWELFNELHRPVLNQLMRPMANLTRTLDPTRLILDESGGWAYGANMYLPNEYEPTKFNDIHNYPGPFIDEGKYDGYLSIGMTAEEKTAVGFKGTTPGKNVVPGLMSFVSELGYGSLPELIENNKKFEDEGNPLTPAYRYHKRLDKEQRQMLAESGFSELYPSMSKFYLDQQKIHGTANKRMIEAVRANPEVDGYCIHALSAGDWILGAGLIDLWRNPKTYAYEGTKAGNQDQIISIRVKPRNVYASKGAELEIIGINDLEDQAGKLEIKIVEANSGKTVYQKSKKVNYKNRVSQLISDVLNTQDLEGAYQVNAELTDNQGMLLTKNSFDFNVISYQDLSRDMKKIGVTEVNGQLAVHLREKGIETIGFTDVMDVKIPVLATGEYTANLKAFIEKGGTVVYLEGAQKAIKENKNDLPFTAMIHPARGLWTCIPHLVHDHPFFEGLPVDTMMRNEYENIWPTMTLRDMVVDGNPHIKNIVASIGFDWFSKEHKLQYSGPGSSWWGSDVAEVHLGKGKFIVSQLRLVPNLGKDPVADKILNNMINYLTNSEND